MKNRYGTAVSLSLLFFFGALIMPVAAQEQATGKIMTLTGKAQIFENGQWKNLQPGASVYATSSIQTGYNSKVVVLLRNGGQVALKPNTTINFNQFSMASKGSSVEVELVNGAVNTFLPKADEGKSNLFKVRSATMVAGVRGSFLSARRHGSHFAVKALHSPAFVEPAPAATEQELVRASLMQAVAQRDGLALQAAEARAALQSPGGAEGARFRLEDAQTKTVIVTERVGMLRSMSADRQGAAAREEIRDLKAQADKQPGNIQGLNRPIPVAEGNTARADGVKLVPPFQAQLLESRPNQVYMPGQNRLEGNFFFMNFDNQAGLGNDFQRLFNNINRLNGPGNAVIPAIRKF